MFSEELLMTSVTDNIKWWLHFSPASKHCIFSNIMKLGSRMNWQGHCKIEFSDVYNYVCDIFSKRGLFKYKNIAKSNWSRAPILGLSIWVCLWKKDKQLLTPRFLSNNLWYIIVPWFPFYCVTPVYI